jgi:hypothetical protein
LIALLDNVLAVLLVFFDDDLVGAAHSARGTDYLAFCAIAALRCLHDHDTVTNQHERATTTDLHAQAT